MIWLIFFGLLVLNCDGALSLGELPRSFELSDEVLAALADTLANQFTIEYLKYQNTGVDSAELIKLSYDLAHMHSGGRNLFINPISDLAAADQFFICTTCRATVNVVVRTFRDPNGELNGPNGKQNTKLVVLDICKRLNIQTPEVCGLFFDFNWPILDYIIQNSVADSRSICGTLPISFCKAKQQEFEWSLNIEGQEAEITTSKSKKPEKSLQDLRLLHLTDIHYDPLYKPYSLAECKEILCCQYHVDEVEVTPAQLAAGYWSDYRDCDSPWHMIENAVEHIKRTHMKIDYIYNTGDIVDHMIWGTSKEKNNGVLSKVNNLLESTFPGIPVYSCVGNHEPHPLNVFGPEDAPADINVKWLYEHLWSIWSKWLPADTKDTILKGGYYTVLPKPGFRIISINNNDCYIFNWWIYYNGASVRPQLEWLHDMLLAAEKAGEFVHILAHIPSGDNDCWPVWAREYNRIIERFHLVISGIFNGHTHRDEINLHYSNNGHAVGISWNGGSLTSYTYTNPNYVLYEVEPASFQVVDYETWILNLTEANAHDVVTIPNWFKEYQFTEAFTDDLSPAGIDALLEAMAENPNLLRKYWRYKMTSADPRLDRGCNHKCLKRVICRLATTVYNQKKRCEELSDKLQIALDGEVMTTENPLGDKASALTTYEVISIFVFFLFSVILN